MEDSRMGKAQREKGKRGEREYKTKNKYLGEKDFSITIQIRTLPPGSAVLRDFRRCGRDWAAGCTYRSKTSGRPETSESAAAVLKGRQGGRDSGGNAPAQPGAVAGVYVPAELSENVF